MDRRNRRKRVTHVLLSSMLSLIILFVGVPLFSAIGVESFLSKLLLVVSIVGSYSMLYLR